MSDEQLIDTNGDDVELLHGGVAHAGSVFRIGNTVERPANPNSATIHRFLGHLRSRGLTLAPEPLAVTDDARELLVFVPGDVPVPPYPSWAQTDDALASIARLMRSMHDASLTFERGPHDTWSSEGGDPSPGGGVIGHNDVCLENVVFRDGIAVALLDFDFAAPGRRSHDVGCFARMCVPIDDDFDCARLGFETPARPDRLRLVADSYGCSRRERSEIIECLDRVIGAHGEFVRRRVEAGDPGFVAMWDRFGGQVRFDRRSEWWACTRDRFVQAMS